MYGKLNEHMENDVFRWKDHYQTEILERRKNIMEIDMIFIDKISLIISISCNIHFGTVELN